MTKLILIKPAFSERVWGGIDLQKYGFKLPNPSKLYGEAWLISDFKNEYATFVNDYNITFHDFFKRHKSKFGIKSMHDYPLLSKIITSNAWLSVQVHPSHEYAMENEQENGKPECWYVLHAEPNSKMVIGHTAATKDEFQTLVSKNDYSTLLKYYPVQTDNFVYIPAGRVHTLGPGIEVFELQISSDITYRLYDFDRLDTNGKKRLLHIKQALDVVKVPDNDINIIPAKDLEILVNNDNFILLHFNTLIESQSAIKTLDLKTYNFSFFQITVVAGEVTILNSVLKKGQSGIVYDISDSKIIFTGNFHIFISSSVFSAV